MKFNIESSGSVTVKLEEDSEGGVVLKVGGYNVLTLTTEGQIVLCDGIGYDVGLQLNETYQHVRVFDHDFDEMIA